MNLDPRTPVIVGVGQASERLGEPGYRRRSPVDLAADAAREAILDAGAGNAADQTAVAAAIDTVAGIRQFENSTPGARAPLGRSDNYPRSMAEPAGALNGARALAAEILDGSPTSVRLSLRVMAETRGIPDVIDAVAHTSSAVDELMISEDMIEGVTAFAAKRPPRSRNR